MDVFQPKKKIKGIDFDLKNIQKTFDMIDGRFGGDKVTLDQLQKRIHIINPNFPFQELANVTKSKIDIKATELYNMLKDNELENFDPLKEAFK